MPKDGNHKGYSLFPSVCSDSCFVEIPSGNEKKSPTENKQSIVGAESVSNLNY